MIVSKRELRIEALFLIGFFKSEQRTAKLARSRACDRLQAALAPQGFSGGLRPPLKV